MRRLLIAATVASGVFMAGTASAAPVGLTGNYIKTAVGDRGTLGSGGGTSPGLIHDPSGTGTFDPANDYITPGTPHQGFSVISDQFGFNQSDNVGYGNFGTASPTLLVGAAAMGYANAATWTGSNGYVSVTNSFFFNPGDQRILISSTLTALTNLTRLAFATSVDPDPDVGKYNNYDTVNQRGNAIFGVDDFVGSAGAVSGLVLGLLNIDAGGLTHSTQINANCCSNISPYDVLSHTGGDVGLSGTGDYGLNLAYSFGDLAAGQSRSVTYAYAVGDRITDTGMPPVSSAVPEPASWATMIGGIGGVGGVLRRRRRKSTAGAFAMA